jgi:hypothetical protein
VVEAANSIATPNRIPFLIVMTYQPCYPIHVRSPMLFSLFIAVRDWIYAKIHGGHPLRPSTRHPRYLSIKLHERRSIFCVELTPATDLSLTRGQSGQNSAGNAKKQGITSAACIRKVRFRSADRNFLARMAENQVP